MEKTVETLLIFCAFLVVAIYVGTLSPLITAFKEGGLDLVFNKLFLIITLYIAFFGIAGFFKIMFKVK